MIDIILVTGFLGCGKTTLLKEIAADITFNKSYYLINEFSKNDVDGKILEINKSFIIQGGSIFCTCKMTSFINTLQMIKTEFKKSNQADGKLIIEASGISNPLIFQKLLGESSLNDCYTIKHIVTIVDPKSVGILINTFSNIVNQITAADTVIINKVDLADENELKSVERIIKSINIKCEMHRTSYCKLNPDIFNKVHNSKYFNNEIPTAPPHNLTSFSLQISKGNILEDFKAFTDRWSTKVFRIKGFYECEGGEIEYVDYSTAGWITENVKKKIERPSIEFIVINDSKETIIDELKANLGGVKILNEGKPAAVNYIL